MSLETPMNAQIRKLRPYVPGMTIEAISKTYNLKKKKVLKLASNENVLGPSPKAMKAIANSMKSLHIYPDGTGLALRDKIASKLKVSKDAIILGNGSNEILEFISRAFLKNGEEVVLAKNTFTLYEFYSLLAGAKVHKIPLKNFHFDFEAALKKIHSKTKIIYICNPNNPTGTLIPHAELKKFLQALHKKVLVVLDEAYGDFREDGGMKQSLEFIKSPNVILLRTFSKIFGLAGLRIGYGVAHPELIQVLNCVRQPFNVNMLAQVAALAGLEDEAHRRKSQWMVWNEKKFLYNELGKMKCLFLPSQANFICIKVGKAKEISERMQEEGVLIRPLDSFGLKEYLRVTIGTRMQNQRVIQSLKDAMRVT